MTFSSLFYALRPLICFPKSPNGDEIFNFVLQIAFNAAGQPSGFGFVQFRTPDDASAALGANSAGANSEYADEVGEGARDLTSVLGRQKGRKHAHGRALRRGDFRLGRSR